MLEHPELGEAMARQIGPADRLKIEQVMAQGDPAAVETLPLQYCGSPAAAAPVSGWAIGPWPARTSPRPCRGMTKVSTGHRPRRSPTSRPGCGWPRRCWAWPRDSRPRSRSRLAALRCRRSGSKAGSATSFPGERPQRKWPVRPIPSPWLRPRNPCSRAPCAHGRRPPSASLTMPRGEVLVERRCPGNCPRNSTTSIGPGGT